MAEKKDKKVVLNERHYDILRKPLITEKGTLVAEHGKVIFEVASDATKTEIKKLFEELYGLKVKSVNILNNKGKRKSFKGVKGARKSTKKAYITVVDGKNVDVIDGIK